MGKERTSSSEFSSSASSPRFWAWLLAKHPRTIAWAIMHPRVTIRVHRGVVEPFPEHDHQDEDSEIARV